MNVPESEKISREIFFARLWNFFFRVSSFSYSCLRSVGWLACHTLKEKRKRGEPSSLHFFHSLNNLLSSLRRHNARKVRRYIRTDDQVSLRLEWEEETYFRQKYLGYSIAKSLSVVRLHFIYRFLISLSSIEWWRCWWMWKMKGIIVLTFLELFCIHCKCLSLIKYIDRKCNTKKLTYFFFMIVWIF